MIFENVHRNKFHGELIENNITPVSVFAIDNSQYGARVIFDEGVNMDLVQQIVENHNPTPSPQQLTEIETLRLENAQANAELFEMMLMLTGGLS